MRELYTENYKSLMKEIKDTNKWQDILYSENGRIKSVKISLLTKAIYRFNVITVKIPVAFIFIEIGKINPKIHMEHTHTHPKLPEKENKAGSITLLGFKIYYKTIAIKTVWYWHKNRHTDQWNRIESPEMNSCIQSTNIWQGLQNDSMTKLLNLTMSPINGAGNWTNTCKRIKLDCCLTPLTQWIKCKI